MTSLLVPRGKDFRDRSVNEGPHPVCDSAVKIVAPEEIITGRQYRVTVRMWRGVSRQ